MEERRTQPTDYEALALEMHSLHEQIKPSTTVFQRYGVAMTLATTIIIGAFGWFSGYSVLANDVEMLKKESSSYVKNLTYEVNQELIEEKHKNLESKVNDNQTTHKDDMRAIGDKLNKIYDLLLQGG